MAQPRPRSRVGEAFRVGGRVFEDLEFFFWRCGLCIEGLVAVDAQWKPVKIEIGFVPAQLT